MGTWLRNSLLAVMAATLFSGALLEARVQDTGALDALREQDKRVAADQRIREDARERWENLSDEGRLRLKERYERFKAMSPQQRAALERRARRLETVRSGIEKDLPRASRKKLNELEPSKRRRIMREMSNDEAREAGRRIWQKLPEDLRQRLKDMTPEERQVALEEFKSKQDEEVLSLAENLGRQLGVEASTLERLQLVPIEQRKRKFLEFVQRLSTEEISKHGLPPGISERRWEALKKLEPDQFFDAITRLRRSHPTLAAPAIEEGGTPPGAPGQLDPTRERLRKALMPDPAERIELAALTPDERATTLAVRRRKRALDVIRKGGLLPLERIEVLKELPDGRFFKVAREVLSDAGIVKSDRGRRSGPGPSGPPKAPKND